MASYDYLISEKERNAKVIMYESKIDLSHIDIDTVDEKFQLILDLEILKETEPLYEEIHKQKIQIEELQKQIAKLKENNTRTMWYYQTFIKTINPEKISLLPKGIIFRHSNAGEKVIHVIQMNGEQTILHLGDELKHPHTIGTFVN